jgi:hypothetical protein
MHQEIDQQHALDAKDRPAGGRTKSTGLTIRWQKGPLVGKDGERKDPNGAFVETVIDAAIGRIEFYQRSQFHCLENAVALGHLKAAIEVLDERTRGRETRGVEGTHTP